MKDVVGTVQFVFFSMAYLLFHNYIICSECVLSYYRDNLCNFGRKHIFFEFAANKFSKVVFSVRHRPQNKMVLF